MQAMPDGDGTILAFDYGLKRIGVAIGNTLMASARPLTTLTQSEKGISWEEVDVLLQTWKPQRLLLGMPERDDGQPSELAPGIKKFGEKLQTRYDLPLSYINEQFSSLEAKAQLKQQRQTGRKKRLKKTDIDKQAAAILLDNWFEEQQHQ